MKILLGISPKEWQKAIKQILSQFISCKISSSCKTRFLEKHDIDRFLHSSFDLAILTLEQQTEIIEKIIDKKISKSIICIDNRDKYNKKNISFLIKNASNIKILQTPITLEYLENTIDELIQKQAD